VVERFERSVDEQRLTIHNPLRSRFVDDAQQRVADVELKSREVDDVTHVLKTCGPLRGD
jgi:hypothetical protein